MLMLAAIAGGLNLPTCWRLAHRGASIRGTVIEVLPNMHATVRYRYNVDGREFFGQRQPRPPNPSFERLAEGAPLTVWYDPEHPEVSVLGLPGALLQGEAISVMLWAVIAPTFILLAWQFRRLWAPT